MKLLIITQSVDRNYVPLCFFLGWLREFGRECEKVTVIAQRTGEYDLPDNVEALSLRKESGLPVWRQIIRAWRLMWSHRKNYDAVLVHMTPIWIVLGAPIFFVLRKRMYLWYEIKTARWPLRVALRLVKKVFSASPGGMPLKTPKSVLTGHGVDTEMFTPGTAERDPKRIVTVSRITRAKRHDNMLRAFAALPQEYSFDIVGVTVTDEDKKTESSIRSLANSMGVSDRVRFATVPDEELVDILQKSTLFLHASEGTSLDKAPLQAMACGCLVVTSSPVVKPHVPEACRANPENMAEVAKKLLAMSAQDQDVMRRELRSIIEREHSLPKLIERLMGEM